MLQRLLPKGPEKGVVDRDRRDIVVEERIPAGGDRLDIHQHVGRVGRAFEIDQGDATHRTRAIQHGVNLVARGFGREIQPLHAEAAEDLADQRLGRGIERGGVDDHVAGLHQREQHRRDRGHPAGEAQRIRRLFPDAEPILQYLLVGPVEARIDEPFRSPRPLAGDALEVALARGRTLEHEGGGQEDRRLQRAFGEHGIVAMPHH